MASAGRILILPKGDYDPSVEYEMLDLVNYNGKSWLAKKTSVGITPSDENSEFWQNMFNITAESIGALNRMTGGTVFGSIVLERDWATISLHDSTDRRAFVEKSPATHAMSLYNYLDDDNYNNLMLLPETESITESVSLKHKVDGNEAIYKIFGEHNIDLLNQYIDARIEAKLNNN